MFIPLGLFMTSLEIGLAAARAVAVALSDGSTDAGGCAAVARAVLAPHLVLERRYDAETRHGATQGASLRER